jgi:hypothetical protein
LRIHYNTDKISTDFPPRFATFSGLLSFLCSKTLEGSIDDAASSIHTKKVAYFRLFVLERFVRQEKVLKVFSCMQSALSITAMSPGFILPHNSLM